MILRWNRAYQLHMQIAQFAITREFFLYVKVLTFLHVKWFEFLCGLSWVNKHRSEKTVFELCCEDYLHFCWQYCVMLTNIHWCFVVVAVVLVQLLILRMSLIWSHLKYNYIHCQLVDKLRLLLHWECLNRDCSGLSDLK